MGPVFSSRYHATYLRNCHLRQISGVGGGIEITEEGRKEASEFLRPVRAICNLELQPCSTADATDGRRHLWLKEEEAEFAPHFLCAATR